MEDKRLNFNRPLISVRRCSPAVANSQRKNIPALPACPSYESLRNPGSVPFVWEQTPGRPKHETKTQKPPIVPNLPPGRILKPKKQDLDIITQGFHVEKAPMSESSKDSKNEKPQLTYGPNFLQFNDNEHDSDFDYDEHVSMSFKLCGLLPHFCLKGSIGIVNPTPGLSVRTKLPISSADTTHVASSSAGSQDGRVVAYEPKSSVKNPQKLEHSPSESSAAFVSEKEEVNLGKKGLVSFKELLAHEDEKEADFKNPAVEKTVYVDIPSEPFWLDKEMMTQAGDRKVGGSELPARPPLPKSPSDSWLWRTLPSVNSKTASLWSNHKPSSKTTTKPVRLINQVG